MNKRFLVGVDLGGTATKFAILSPDGGLIHKWEIETDNRDHGKNIVPNIGKSIKEAFQSFNVKKEEVVGIGIGVPGPVDYASGAVFHTPNLAWKDHYPLKQAIEEQTGLPSAVENDANCAALGEMWQGAGKDCKDLICITLGTGIGGGVIVGGKIVRGKGGAAGEIGHYTVDPEGSRCNCGKKGCLETIASATGIVRLALEKIENGIYDGLLKEKIAREGAISAKDVFEQAKNGDSLCMEVVDFAAFHLGLALANAANILNPEKIVIGGGVAKAGPFLLDKVNDAFSKFAFSKVRETTILSLAQLGHNAGVYGAASLAAKSW